MSIPSGVSMAVSSQPDTSNLLMECMHSNVPFALSAALKALSNAFSENATASLKDSSTPAQTSSTLPCNFSRKDGCFWDSTTIWLVICSSGMMKAEVMAASGNKVVINFILMNLMGLMKLQDGGKREEMKDNKLEVA